MTEQKYNAQEALERIYRALSDNIPESDVPGNLPGTINSWDVILSRIAELLSNSLPKTTFTLPPGTAYPTNTRLINEVEYSK